MGSLIPGCTSHTRVSAATDVSEFSRTSLILVAPLRPRRYLITSWVLQHVTGQWSAGVAEDFGH